MSAMMQRNKDKPIMAHSVTGGNPNKSYNCGLNIFLGKTENLAWTMLLEFERRMTYLVRFHSNM